MLIELKNNKRPSRKRGKTKADYIKSLNIGRQEKATLRNYFGFIPYSVLNIPDRRLKHKLYNYQIEVGRETTSDQQLAKKIGIRNFQVQQAGAGRGKKGLSIMPPEWVEFFIKFYCKKDSLYFDPFAGQGIRIQIANLLGVNYIGYDICKEYVNYIKSFMKRIKKKSEILEIHFADSRKIHLKDNSVDFSFTSPPYWDIEIYDNNEKQVGQGTYEDFLENLREIIKEQYRIFKPGGVCVWNVNDFSKNKIYYSFHADVIRLFKEVGFHQIDTWILTGQLSSTLPRAFATGFIKNKRSPKTHEYALVFEK